ncbi:MAG: ECF transporter S component [Coriobacteriia bacterium]|nr:ECF transporter S component [Coriobacteriia bacterium]
MRNNSRTLFITQFSALLAIEIIFCFTPLGSLPAFGPIVATLGMIPVVITSILLGTKPGTVMGALTGLFSFIVWTFMPPSPLVAFVFSPFHSFGEISGGIGSLLICFVPRTLVGTVAGLTYTSLSKAIEGKRVLRISISAAAGSMTNTLGVMGGIWLFFGEQYSSIAGSTMLIIVGTTILMSGIPEALASLVISSAVCEPLLTIFSRREAEAPANEKD